MGTTSTVFSGNRLIETFNEYRLFRITSSHSFTDCVNLRKITFPSTMVTCNSFVRCYGLEELYLNEGCTTVSRQCFWGSYFTQIYPTTMTTIRQMNIDTNGSQYYDVICKATSVPTLDSVSYYGHLKAVYVPDESFDSYKTASSWSTLYNNNKLKKKSELPDNLKKYWP